MLSSSLPFGHCRVGRRDGGEEMGEKRWGGGRDVGYKWEIGMGEGMGKKG